MKFRDIDFLHLKPKGFPLSLLYGFFGIYMVFTSLTGDRGIISWLNQSSEYHRVEHDLQQLSAKRENLELKVTRLSGDAVDLDLLEEEVRKSLGKSKSTEMVVILQ